MLADGELLGGLPGGGRAIGNPPPLCPVAPVDVYHYKWVAGVVEYLHDRARNFRQAGLRCSPKP